MHPKRVSAAIDFLTRAEEDGPVVHLVIAQGQRMEMEYEGGKFYMRRLYCKKV
jgi:hypothetical protein